MQCMKTPIFWIRTPYSCRNLLMGAALFISTSENTNTPEVKNDTHVASDESSSDVEIVGVYMPSECCVGEAEDEEMARELQHRPNAEYTHFYDGRETCPFRSTQESHQLSNVLKHTSTWTSQRNWGSRTSYEGRNVPSVRGARQGTWNSGVRRRRFRRKNRIWNAADMSMTHSLAQHRGGGGNHSVALREDVATVSQKNEVETEEPARELQHGPSAEYTHFHDVDHETFPLQSTKESPQHSNVPERTSTWTSGRKWGSRTLCEERKVPSGQGAWQGTVKLGVRINRFRGRTRISNAAAKSMTDSSVQHRRGGRFYDVTLMGDGTVGRKHNVDVMGDVETIGQKNEEKTEGTVSSVADEKTHQNHDEVIVLQEDKETISVSAAGLKSKTEHKERDDSDADFCFLQSLVPDMKKLSDRKKLKFKELIISSIGQLLEED